MSAVLDYVRARLSEPLTVADMAEQVSLSPSAFAHLFRDVTGKAPYQFLKEMRLDRARELLVDGTWPSPASPRKWGTPASPTSSANSGAGSA
jgi:transcriptional regulator GlxA family with amidase domain